MDISKSVKKRDHELKIAGEAIYVADYPTEGMLFGKVLRSIHPRARVLNVALPQLPEDYLYIDRNDVPGINEVHIVQDDTPVFANETVEYIGEPIGMIIGPDEERVDALLKDIVVSYEVLPSVLTIEDSDTVFFNYKHSKGDVDKAFKEADKIYEEVFETGYQEHAYLETQGMIAEPQKDRIIIHGSMQCPFYVHNAVKKVLGIDDNQIEVQFDTTGGAFGGKEGYPSILACQVAVAANKAKKPVCLIFNREEDMSFSSKKHPGKYTYKVAVKNKQVTAMDINLKFNSGAYTTLSPVVLQRGTICANGVYNIPNLRAEGKAIKTNTVPNGAFRGFGAPQVFFASEMMMNHIAKDLGIDPLEFKMKHIYKLGDETSTQGKHHFPVPLNSMVKQVIEKSQYKRKYDEYQHLKGRFRKGIGISMFYHGCGFTGNGERDLIKSIVKLHKFSSGKVEILVVNTDMGQGLKTTLSKIVGKELNIPVDEIIIRNPNTTRVPDSGPTVASRSLMIVGELLRKASIRLKDEWVDGKEQLIEEHYKHPEFLVPFSLENFVGDAYPAYSWAVNVVEIEVDTVTGVNKIINSYGVYDVGTPIDTNIVIGQMEGGLAQTLGHSSMELMPYDLSGKIRNNTYSDYIIPTAMDIPNMECSLHVEKYTNGPYGAKGAGELPAVGGTAAYSAALEQALGNISINHIPFSAEDAMKVLRKEAK
ncbi:aldehyde oxidase [endosymbiont 'TC1' of Trimyema compressum]|uniref:xanthine dehydrogenase family protein molybdopterin-binding subunit n=1 Tax=endosymbiont 'TC1' of Trimyema compressum TaxID=243899 RepID=UPI0007F128A3|nr:xanthine dehydrogenase family protein molybdopterin-binding subunit [endosymbiont 'TC1' of Trimyema compressum]AMP20853.1 aldehyde oxidase [endosymbiont 'TC1' of Trimyema compressum]